MTELSKIQELVDEELKEANKKYPLFSSDHEAYAVIKEEYEECRDELSDMASWISRMWEKIKIDEENGSEFAFIKNHALYAAAEAIQVAAMCDKAMMNKDAYLNGWIKCEKTEKMTSKNVCNFCKSNPDECGEYPECCYDAIMRESK